MKYLINWSFRLWTHLFVQTGLDLQRFVRHDKVPGGLDRGRYPLALRSVLHLPEHQLHCAPVVPKRTKSSTLDIVHFQLCSRLLPSDRTRWHSPFAYFGVLALSAERLNLKLHSTLLQKRRDENASPACEAFVSSLLTHEFESYLSDITGCWLQGHWARQVIGELQRRKTNVCTVWRLRQNHSFPLMCQHVNVCLWSMNQSLVLNGYSDDVTTLGLNFQTSSGSRTSSRLSYSYSFCHKISPHTWDLAKTWL